MLTPISIPRLNLPSALDRSWRPGIHDLPAIAGLVSVTIGGTALLGCCRVSGTTIRPLRFRGANRTRGSLTSGEEFSTKLFGEFRYRRGGAATIGVGPCRDQILLTIDHQAA